VFSSHLISVNVMCLLYVQRLMSPEWLVTVVVIGVETRQHQSVVQTD